MKDEGNTKDQLVADGQQKQNLSESEKMQDQKRAKEQLINELAEMRQRIAELEAADIRRKQTDEALWESEKRFRSVAETASDAIIIFDGHENVFFWNQAAQVIFGYQAGETRGRLLASIMPKRLGEVFRGEMDRMISTGESDLVGKTVEVIGVRKDGNEFPSEVSFAPWKTREGFFFTIIARDISERKRAEEELRRYHEHLEELVEERTAELKRTNEQLEQEITERRRAEEELRQSYVRLRKTLEGTIHVLVSAIDRRDPYTAGHQRRVAQLACAIAKEMGLSEERIEGTRMAAAIHDIGKVNVPAEILNKPGRLSHVEFGLIKIHPQVGHDILDGAIDFPWPVAEMVLQHHERMDGSGYPQGLSGEEILLEARILAVADVVEAMSSRRPYRSVRNTDKALDEISRNRGLLYDPEVVDACLKLFTEERFGFE
jgi:PAS domain S-box-containing protein